MRSFAIARRESGREDAKIALITNRRLLVSLTTKDLSVIDRY
jgi:hypothetical protein